MAAHAFIGLLLAARLSMAQTCYWPDKTQALGFSACPGVTESSEGACCDSRDSCFSNGMCFSIGQGTIYRGGCTDVNWNSDACASHCQNINPGGPGIVSSCQNHAMCCTTIDDESNNKCCAGGSSNVPFNWNVDNPLFTGPLNASKLLNVTDAQSAITGVTSNATVTVTPSSNASNENTTSKSAVIGVGIGLGIPLLIASATSGWLFFALRKARRQGHATLIPEKSTSPDREPGPYDTVQPRNHDYLPQQGYAYAQEYKSPTELMPTQQPRPAELATTQDAAEVPAS